MNDTTLYISMGQLPADLHVSPQQFAVEMVKRMKIVSTSAVNFISTSESEPTSNVGPWLKDGNKWYVFDEDLKRYVPVDISDSEITWFQVGASTPLTADPSIWLRTTKDATESDPSIGRPIGWYVNDGSGWHPFVGITPSGPTTERPTNPIDFQQFYDSTIACLIWWERDAWRTVSGVPGDIKHVSFNTLTEAITANPGWALFGGANLNLRGRWISGATKDSGGSPETDLSVAAGVTKRAAFEEYGTTTLLDSTAATPDVIFPATVALWTLVKE